MKKKPIHICMIVFSQFPSDVRVRRESWALAEAGIKVDIICLLDTAPADIKIPEKIKVYRLPIKRNYSGKLTYIWQNLKFFLLSFFKVTCLHFKNRYKIIHIHNMPDFLVFCSLIPRLTGAKIILDLHDPMPELMITKYSISESSFIVKILQFMEKWSIAFAHQVFTPNIAFRDVFTARGCPEKKIHILMNSPQEEIFLKQQKKVEFSPGGGNAFVVMYHGALFKRQGIDNALLAINILRHKIPHLKFIVFGYGDFEQKFLELTESLGLKDIVDWRGYAILEKIVETIPQANIGLIPNKLTPFTNINLPVRIFEYLIMGKPVIAPRTKGIKDYFDEDSLFFFDADNIDNLVDVIYEVYSNPVQAKQKWEKAHQIYLKYRWELQKKQLVQIVQKLAEKNL